MSEAERNDLFEQVTDWYYTDGNGMLLTDKTRQLYLKAKQNLRYSDDELFPASLCAEAHRREIGEQERWRSEVSRRQLSLLRTQMKADLAIYGIVSAGSLHGPEHRLERDFLEACGINLEDEPWIHPAEAAGRDEDQSRRAWVALATSSGNSGSIKCGVNRIKKIKRQLCGRAGIELLRKMILLQ
ncbi:hypothetical protein [Streptomyces sp. NPDC059010]|uniref:hypothetical protein n=1 Tax=Streptomyces sp. NPDC059010 TaxID=3346695 RepID=UPI0036CF3FBF